MSIFKACDVRGVYGEDLDESVARRIGRALGGMLRRRGQREICVGGDFRRSTPPLKSALCAGLLEAGIMVHDLGQLPTPVIYFAGRHLPCPNVAVVTASHNPGKYNGIKFMVDGQPALPELLQELQAGLDEPAEAQSPGHVRQERILPVYEEWILKESAALVQSNSAKRGGGERPVSGQRLKVVVDTMHGVYSEIAPRLLGQAGCEVVVIGAAIDPDFTSRPPNPAVDKNIQELCRRVPAERADLGLALDGDGDRVIFVDDRGGIIRPEQIGALLVRECFAKPLVVYDLKCASVLAEAVRAAGGGTIMQPSGYGYIKTMMIRRQADLGLEVSGHHFYKVLGGGDDGLFTALLMVHLRRRLPKPLSELIAAIGWPAITPDLRIPFQGDVPAALERIAAGCGGQVTRLDGVRAQYDDGWALARSSITEPVITLRCEGRDQDSLRQVAARFLAAEPDLQAKVLEMIHE